MNIPTKRTAQLLNDKIACGVVLGLIGTYCLFSSTFYRQFAELNVQFPFLNFPVFIGEIFLFVCMLISGVDWPAVKKRISPEWQMLIFGYGVWVFFKAIHGYITFGPLAFRNAAQFYYVFFAVAGYCFYRKEFFTQKSVIGLLGVMLFAKIIVGINNYFVLPYLILTAVLALQIRNPWVKYPAFFLIIFVPTQNLDSPTLVPFVFFFMGGRGRVLGHLVAFLFLFAAGIFVASRVRVAFKIPILLVGIGLLSAALITYMDKNSLKSMFNLAEIVKLYKEHEEIIRSKSDLPLKDIRVNLYSQENIALAGAVSRRLSDIGATLKVLKPKEWIVLQTTVKDIVDSSKTTVALANKQVEKDMLEQIKAVISDGALPSETPGIAEVLSGDQGRDGIGSLKKTLEKSKVEAHEEILKKIELIEKENELKLDVVIHREKAKVYNTIQDTIDDLGLDKEISIEESLALVDTRNQPRDIATAFYNILFRLFIWRDMGVDLLKNKALFWGVNFGKPQRSRSIEVFGWASVEWEKDGWITAHNSLLHYIYRGGIVGVLLVAGLLGTLAHLTRKFILAKSFGGILMVGIFVYWVTISNFLVFLELPYNAIPFWSLLGMMLAYGRTLCEGTARLSKP